MTLHKKKNIFFVFRFFALDEVLSKADKVGATPTEFLYGYNVMDKERFACSYGNAPQGKRTTFLRKAFYVIEWPWSVLSRLGLPLEIVPLFWKQMREADVIVAANDSISFAVLVFKRLGFIRADVISIVQSAHERCGSHFRLRFFTQRVVGWLLRGSAHVLTLAECARNPVHLLFGVPLNKITHHPFVVDVDFWKPSVQPKGDFILSIGNDFNRDYQVIIDALRKEKAVFITKKVKDGVHQQVIIKSGLTNEQVRDCYARAGAVVVASRALRYESSGFSCALQAAACGAPLIISDSPPMRELFTQDKHCLFFEPGNSASLRRALDYAQAHPKEMIEMGKRARDHVVETRTPLHAAKSIQNAIEKL